MVRREAGGIGCRFATALVVAATLSGCSFDLSGLGGERVEATGSITAAWHAPLSPDLGQEDWRRAKGALAIALDPQGSGSAVNWDNPDTKVSGTFTPVSQPYVKSNEICRAFLAAIAFPQHHSSLQGTACRLSADDWEIRDLRPWNKPA